MPVDAAPAEIDVLRIVAQDKGRRIGRIVGRCQILLVAQLADVTGLFRYTVPNLGLIRVACVEDHHTLVGQDDEGGVVVVVGLKTRAHKNVRLALLQPVVLRRFDIAVHIDVTDVGHLHGAGGVLVVRCTRIGKPTPGSLESHQV